MENIFIALSAVVLGWIVLTLCRLFIKHQDLVEAALNSLTKSIFVGIIVYLLCMGGWWTFGTIVVLVCIFADNMRYGNS